MPFGTAALIGAGVSAASGLLGGIMQSGNASSAAKQAQWNRQLALQNAQQNYVTTRNDLMPYATAGEQGLTATQDLLGLNGPDAATAAFNQFRADPGYQWQLDQGLRAVDAGAAAKGMLRSGATLKAEQAYGSGLADQTFQNYYKNLFNLSEEGRLATAGLAQANQNLTSSVNSLATGAADQAMQSANAQNSIIGNTAQGLSNNVNQLLNTRALSSFLSPSTSAVAPGSATPIGYQSVPTQATGNTWYW